MIQNIKAVRGVPDCPECDKEVKTALKKMPAWKPATCNGVPVNASYTISVCFNVF